MDQLRGVLNQVGGDAKEMQAAMSSAFRQIVVGFVDVGKALGQFVTGAFVDASKAIVNFISDTTGISSFRKELELMATSSDKAIASIGRFGVVVVSAIGGAAVASVMAFTVALAAGVVAMYQLGKEQTAIAQANAQFGGAFGASTQEVISFNKELQSVGVTSSDVSVIFTEVAKAGNIGKESFVGVTKAAADFETYVGGKATDAVKVFSETIKDPVKGLTEFGVKTGYVNQEQVELVKKLIETGQGAEAQKLAIGFLEQGYAKMTTNAKAGMSSLDLSLIEAGKSLSELWDNFKNSQGVGEGFRLLWETVAVIGSEVWFTLKAVGIEIGGIGAQIAAVLRGDFSGAKTIGEQMKQDAEVAAKAQEELVKRILDRSKVQKDSNEEDRKSASAKLALSKENEIVEKALAKSDKDALSRSEYQKKQLEELNKQLVNRKVTTEELARLEKKWGEDWDKAHKQKKDPTESFFASSIKTFAADTAKAIGIQEQYTKAQVDFLKIASDPKWLKLTEDERAAIAVKAEAAAKEEVLAKAYLATKKAEEDAAKATSNIANEIEKLIGIKSKSIQFQQMLDEQLMLGNITFEQYVKAINDYSAALDKISSDKAVQTSMDLSQNAADRLALIKEESEDLKLQKSIYGFFTVDQKRILEQAKVTRDLRKEILGIEKLTTLEIDKGGITAAQAEKHKAEAYEAAAEKRKNIEQAAALEMYKYYSDALADVISTSLYEGGKAGSKKLRDLIIAELKKPITVVVNAVVSTIMNSVTGGVASAAGSSMLGAAGASFIGSSSALSLGAQAGFGALLNGGGIEAMGSAFTALTEGTMASFAAGLGTLAGVLGPIAGVAMLLSSLDDSGTYHTGGGASYSAATGAVESSVGFQLNPSDVSSSAVDFAKQFTTAIGQMLDATALAFGKTAGYEIATAFADDVSSDGAWGSLVIKKGTETILDWSKTQTSRWAPKEFADGEEGKKQYLAAVAKDVRDTLINETPSWADAMLNALGEAPTIDGLTQTVTLINQTQSAFEAMALASSSFTNVSDELVNSLIKATGGAANLVSGLNYYYQNFFSEEERKLVMQQQVNTEFAKFNKEVPTTREGFKTLVEAAMAAGDAELVSNLLKVAPAFAAVTKSTDEVVAAAKEAADKLAKEVADKIKEAMDAAKKATDDAYSALQKAISKQKEFLSSQLTVAESLASSLDNIFNLLKDNVHELYAEVTATSNMQVQQAYAIISNARTTGVLPSQDVLSQAIGTVRGSFDSNNYASKFEADRARLLLANDLAALQGIAGEQLTEAQQQIKLIKDQIEQYDLILENAEIQINELRGINTSVLSVTSAVDALTAALIEEKKITDPSVSKPTQSGGFVIGGGVSGKSPDASTASRLGNTYYGSMGIAITDAAYVDRFDSVNSFVNTLDWSAGNKDASTAALIAAAQQYGVSANEIAIATGYSRDDVISLTGGQLPKFANGGYHSGGVRLVGENSPELEVTGPARYYNKDQFFDVLRSGFSGNNDNNESTEMLRAEVRSIAISTSKLQRIIDALVVPTSGGEAINVKVVV